MIDEKLAKDLDELATGCRVLQGHGHGDKTVGHLSLRDPRGRGFWLKRAQAGLDEIRSSADFVLLDFNGNRLHGEGGMHFEWPIHSEIYKSRPEINVVGHTHPFYASLFAALDVPLKAIAHEACYFESDVPRYRGTTKILDTPQLGCDLADVLGRHHAVFMQNHGITFCGASTAAAVVFGIILEKACKQQITLAAYGAPMVETSAAEVVDKARSLTRPALLKDFFDYYCRQLATIEKLGFPAWLGRELPG